MVTLAAMSSEAPRRHEVFATTHWSAVQLAARHDTTRAQQALSELCEAYWYPLYAYVRRQGTSPHDAQDLTQEFFARFLAGNYLEGVSPDQGRFRSFLLACLKHFLANEWAKARAAKRGGGLRTISFDETEAEDRYRLEPADEQPYSELARELEMSEGAVKVAVHRFRQRYRELLRQRIGQTVSSATEVDEEIRYLFSVLG
jgi:DNA-directed RNA polymerase specialized sigma24 family protein